MQTNGLWTWASKETTVFSRLKHDSGQSPLIRVLSQYVAYHLIRACYIAMPLYLCGFLVLGASFQEKLSVGALVMGWGLAEVAVMINTVAVCESPPHHPIRSLTS